MEQPSIDELKLFYEPADRLRLTVGDERSYVTVKPAWASPLSQPRNYLSLLDGKGEEIVLIQTPEELSEHSFRAVSEELRRRYLAAAIIKIEGAKVEFGATYWHVITDRGQRDFVTQSLQENAQWLSERHLVLVDVDQNRFEIPDVDKLDPVSRATLRSIL